MHTQDLSRRKIVTLFAVVSAFTIPVLFITSAALAEAQDSIATLRQMGKAFASIAEKASPAVVGIKAEKTVSTSGPELHDWPFGDPFGNDFFDNFFRRQRPRRRAPRQQRRQLAQGSGLIISPDGYILTNNHLVGEAEKVTVTLSDNRQFEAKIIGTDPESDVAVVKIDADKLSYLELADSDKLEVGEWVIAIGNPFGLNHTVTAGIVSAKGRSGVGLSAYEDFIQTDAAINPGNSGGPLLDLNGQVVGINTAIISRTGGSMGIGLAIPVNMARNIYQQLVEKGQVVRGFLGISMEELTPELAKAFDLEDARGIAVTEVIEGTAAEKAGLKRNDVIVEFEGRPAEKANELRNRVAQMPPGTKIELVVIREGKRKTITAELGERPKEGIVAAGSSDELKELGMTVQNLTDELAERLGYEGASGVVVTEVESGSVAATAGIRPGALVMEVDREPVKNTKQFQKAIEKAAKDDYVLLLINTGRANRYIILKWPKK